MTALPFALNHMAAPALPVDAFFSLAKSLGISMVEIRNDLAGNAIADGTPPEEVKALAEKHGLTIVSINALQRFNEWNEQRADEARELISYARDCGAKALVLVPVNDGSGKEDGVRQSNLRQALGALKPMLDAAGITGLVEPLGFEACSLRSKAEAAEAIRAVSGERSFRLVHDTFHHHLAGEDQFFPDLTGLVHISGVIDANLAVSDMRDPHRVLVDAADRLDNQGQIRRLQGSRLCRPLLIRALCPLRARTCRPGGRPSREHGLPRVTELTATSSGKSGNPNRRAHALLTAPG
jgi:2-keto-myo-inositol isomerase